MILLLALARTDGDPPADSDAPAAPCEGTDGSEAPSVTLTPAGTSAYVRWTTGEPASGRVIYQSDGGPERATAWGDATTDHEVLIWGLVPGASTVVQVEGEGGTCGEPTVFDAGPLPVGTPSIVPPEAAVDLGAPILLPVLQMEGSWAVVLDEAGRVS